MDDVPFARLPSSQRVFERVVDLVAQVIRQAVAQGQPHLLLDVREAAFDAPTLVDRLHMARQWAEAADGRLRIAVVARPEFIDPERFGVVAAGNFGLAGQVFEQEEEAIAWLRAERTAELARVPRPQAHDARDCRDAIAQGKSFPRVGSIPPASHAAIFSAANVPVNALLSSRLHPGR